MIEHVVRDLAELERCAAALALALEPGDVIELEGEMGAGKTTFTGTLARALGITEPVRSPTYTIAHRLEHADGRTLAHLDCWRSVGAAAVDAEAWADLEPYLASTWTCIEWPEPMRQWLAGRSRWHIELQVAGETLRILRITAPDAEREQRTATALTGPE